MTISLPFVLLLHLLQETDCRTSRDSLSCSVFILGDSVGSCIYSLYE